MRGEGGCGVDVGGGGGEGAEGWVVGRVGRRVCVHYYCSLWVGAFSDGGGGNGWRGLRSEGAIGFGR